MGLTPEAAAARERLFLERVRAAMESVREIHDPITGEPVAVHRVTPAEIDGSAGIRRMAASLGVHDAELLARLPRDRCLLWRVRERGFLLGRRVRMLVLAAVVNPTRQLLLGDTPPRASFAAVAGLVETHLAGDGPGRMAGIYSPTGWDPAIRVDAVRRPGMGLWLFEPGRGGEGFSPVDRRKPPPSPFDIQSRTERIEQVIAHVEERRFDLLMRGLRVGEVAQALQMGSDDVRAGLEEAVRRDEFLVLDDGDEPTLRRV